MSNVNAQIHASSKVPARTDKRRIPFGIRCLTFLTTSKWRPSEPVHPSVAACANKMASEGWMIRGAWPRNYLLWRNGRTMQEGLLPLVVLPLAHRRLSALQLNIFLAVELKAATERLHSNSRLGLPAFDKDEFEALVDRITAETGLAVTDPQRLHQEAARALERKPTVRAVLRG